MKLTTQVVEDFLRLKAKVKQLSELQKNLTKDIREEMVFLRITEYGPSDCQQVLYLSRYKQFDPTYYMDMAEWAYKKLYGRKWKEVFEDHAVEGMRKVVALKNRVNPDYKRKKKVA